MKRKTWKACAAVCLAVLLLLGAGCAQKKETAQGKTLTIAITNDENSLTPFTYVSATGTVVNRLIYDTLFITDLENNVVPWMVQDDYEVDDTGTTYTVTLLDGQFFHDGTPVTAQDVVFSFTYPATQNVSSQRRICEQIARVEAVDEKTVTFELKSPDVNFLRSGLASMRIISKAQYENVQDATSLHETMGSGMYRLKEYSAGQYYVLEAVDNYFKGDVTVDTINMPIMRDATAVQTALLSGQIAAATSSIGAEMLETFDKAQDLSVFANAGYAPMMLNINNDAPILCDAAVRDALTYAIDVSGIMQTLYGAYATVGTRGIVRPDMPYAVEGLPYVFDPDRADQMLDAAGYDARDTDGVRLAPDGTRCSFELLVYSGNTVRIRAAELIAGQLADVGIEIEVSVMEMDTVDAYVWPDFEVSQGRDYDLAMWGWGSSMDPAFLVYLFASDYDIGTYNVCGYKNDAVNAIVTQQFLTATTQETLYAALADIQREAASDPGLICFGYADALQVCNTAQYDGFCAGKGANVVNVYSFLNMETE